MGGPKEKTSLWNSSLALAQAHLIAAMTPAQAFPCIWGERECIRFASFEKDGIQL